MKVSNILVVDLLLLLPDTIDLLILYHQVLTLFFQEEREVEEKRLQEIMEENNKKILEAQRKLASGIDWGYFGVYL